MIKNIKDLIHYLKTEKKIYISDNKKDKIVNYITNDQRVKIWKYIKLLRRTEYFYNMKKSIYRNIMYLLYRRRKNVLGIKLGIEIWENTFEEGLNICHSGVITINGNSKIGKNCILHGDNCIGNNGKNKEAPKIGNNVDIGVGAKIYGDIIIADNIKIGAGAIVNKSFLEKGITIAGVPAKKVERNKQN